MSDPDLDSHLDELLPLIRREATGDAFLFDPKTLKGSTRHYFKEYPAWLGIDEKVLPRERIWIHADHEHPASIERRTVTYESRTVEEFALYINNGLYRSREAVKMALAHEVTHLYLMLNGHQAPLGDTGRVSETEEIRTDVASIVLGFGKLVLNGVCAFKELHLKDGYDARLSYLPSSSFSYLYQKVNDLMDVPDAVATEGLNKAALRELAGGTSE
ncbi:hypothetical protein OHR68_34310 [Spirillospora sp. NBC_00431]